MSMSNLQHYYQLYILPSKQRFSSLFALEQAHETTATNAITLGRHGDSGYNQGLWYYRRLGYDFQHKSSSLLCEVDRSIHIC